MPRTARRLRLPISLTTVLWIVGGWTAFATLGVVQYAVHRKVPLGPAVTTNVIFAVSWVLTTPLVIAVAAALAEPCDKWRRAALGLALLAIPLPPMLLRAALAGDDLLHELRFAPLDFFGSIYENAFPALLIILVTYNALEHRRNARRRRDEAEQTAELTRVQLQVLRATVEPHFLFNALNSVAALIRTDARQARHVLRQLSELLHTSVFTADEVPLREEMAFITRYLGIQKTRFRDRLAVQVELSPAAGAALVPPLILQPLVENAITHGIAGTGGTGTVEVTADEKDGRLFLQVRDTGAGFDAERRTTSGIGLSSVRTRLRLLYGADHSVTFHHDERGFVVHLTLPARWETA